ncbi:MAG: hypothetical protein K6E59_05300 [Bacilli bacterium]|nr:hypothetical protein [Bacilli bacterium]
MRIFHKILLSVSSLGFLAAGAFAFSSQPVVEAKADSGTSYPRNGQSGTMLYVNGNSTYFNTGEADLAIYCWNNSGGAWSGKTNARLYGDLLPIAFPTLGGNSVTWSYFKICRYNPSKDPGVDGEDGVYNETASISIGNLMYAQNTFVITGYGEGKSIHYQVTSSQQYGLGAEKHVYLDLSSFPSWEEDGAKFGLYFARPFYGWSDGWGVSHVDDKTYAPSFCWKVQGQDNDHLYECIVPNYTSLWSMVIAVRFKPAATAPGWNNVWNQTQDLGFNSGNESANVIEVQDWNRGELEATPITMAARVGFYGQFFLDTVKCSGTGATDATTSGQWTAVASEYQYHLSRIHAGEVWKAEANQTGTILEQAVARYDEIVFVKGYSHADFMNRVTSEGRVVALGFYDDTVFHSDNSKWIIVLLAGAFGATLAGLLYAFARKRNKVRD